MISLAADIRQKALSLGAAQCGFARAECVSDYATDFYDQWIADGKHGTMDYCARYADVRRDPRLLLDNAKTIISCAFAYAPGNGSNIIAAYAHGDDYHYVIKSKLATLAEYVKEKYGGETRVVVDTAPMRERYWAQRAGIGFVGLNNQLITENAGSYCLLGELLWTGEVTPDSPSTQSCLQCGRCIDACPGRALDGKGGCDASRCLSYLTIEHRGDLPEDAQLKGAVYGCDICQRVCPHNQHISAEVLPELRPNPAISSVSRDELLQMTPSHYKRLTAHSAMRRAPLKQLQRNINHN